MRYLILFFLAANFFSCNSSISDKRYFTANDESFRFSGRIQQKDEGVALINSAASVRTKVFGDSAIVHLESGNENHQYASVELDEKYLGRHRIDSDSLLLDLPNNEQGSVLEIYKDTEASNGALIFRGITARSLEPAPVEEKPLIEFIGNSITCGMGADTREIACEEGDWFDQHNAYLAYGPRVARALDADFELSCVSGIGMYRNWNDEDRPVMPDVYSNLFLNDDSSQKARAGEDHPEVVSIALGTNDLSFGDGEKERSNFDPEKFTSAYISFVEEIFAKYPDTRIALLSSPMVGEREQKILHTALEEIKSNFANRPVSIFKFDEITPHGCTSHPDIHDHEEMAEQLVPLFRNLLNQN